MTSSAPPFRPDDPIALTQALVRCPTVTPVANAALDVLEEALAPLGFRIERPRFSEPGTPDVDNLYARLGDGAPVLVFAGHVDVVPVGQEAHWTHPPFGAEISEGKLWGRGAADMKSGVAASVAAVARHLARHGQPAGSIVLLITGDEEGPAINGTAKLLAWAAARGERFDHCLLPEPTNPDTLGDMIKIGRRGSLTGHIVVHGKQGHVAYPERAENPIRGMVRLLAALDQPLDEGTAHFAPSTLEITSVDVGNPASNVVPAEARAVFNIRFNDAWTQETLAAAIAARLSAVAGVRHTLTFEPSNAAAFVTAPGPFVDLVADAAEAVSGRRPALSTTGGTSDARFIKDYCPVIEFGTVGRTMHQVDEHVAVADVEGLTRIFELVIERYFTDGVEIKRKSSS
jgi:succinyl-diaminopimelate desuccinylase